MQPKLKPQVTLHYPTVEDIDAIDQLVRLYSVNSNTKRVLLPRTIESLLADLQNFITLKVDQEIVGCVSLKIWNKERAEVRSLAIKQEYLGLGMGKLLLKELEIRARQLKIKTLFALTLEPTFFKKSGFHVVPKLRFPEKVAGDCVNCVFQSHCQEVAVSKTLTSRPIRLVAGGLK